MPILIDAKGKNCPIPVVLAKKEIDGGANQFSIEVDNPIAVQNLQRLADSQNFRTTVESAGGISKIIFTRDTAAGISFEPQPANTPVAESWTVLVGRCGIGSGDPALGSTLMRMFFYTLTQSEHLPASVLFLNDGVRLPTGDAQIIEHLRALQAKGVEILVCGTCLNFYQLTDRLEVGTVSNMYDLVTRMQQADKVITL